MLQRNPIRPCLVQGDPAGVTSNAVSPHTYYPPFNLADNPSSLQELNQEAVNAQLSPPQQQPSPPQNPPSPPPYAWATNDRCDGRVGLCSLDYLMSAGITEISGTVKCRFCDRFSTLNYDLMKRFGALKDFIRENKAAMRGEAPKVWNKSSINLPECTVCHKARAMKPCRTKHPRTYNWLFMLLGQTLAVCSPSDLDYFFNRYSRQTQLLYLTYLGLCKQLEPNEPLFDP
ncbi:uncharacterized protein LOC130783650 [Actinidia eriantha]|uniref:uncharacterized protein LOC130783650 n=1 Tax=Actinidia eriantha TaxID=165200 RepID=UPI002589A46B|nr:uncharacterized protein LOC130783650 [Actinidia eriantha]